MRALLKEIEAIPTLTRFGRVARIEGLAVEVTGAQGAVSLGGQCRITIGKDKKIPCEVVGFRDGRALVMPLGPLDGITLGARADFEDRPASIYPSTAWLGRVIDGFGQADGRQGPAGAGHDAYPLKAAPPPATRARPRRRQAGSGRARPQCLRHLLRRPAHGHFLRLRRRQIHACWPCWRAIPMPTPL